MSKATKRKVLKTLDRAEEADTLSKRFDTFIMTLILLNVAAVIIETVDSIHDQYSLYFQYFEVFSVVVFSAEYLFRVWACTVLEKYKHPLFGRIRYMFSASAIIDLLAILPFYLPFVLNHSDGRIIRILRLARLVRIFKLGRYSQALTLISDVVKKRREELIVTLTLLIIMLIFASTLMYYIEYEPDKPGFQSIPETMWWGVATLTTVGYGDVYPVTALGKLLGAAIAIMGVGLFALPAGIVAAGFESELKNRKKKDKDQE
ncbi:ion transporter [Roseivirga sp.]|uniref:ion transporter n=1 Tax=Roseivirga sp. TaxID=1964215 RepID=UPI003B8DF22F